MNDLSMRLMRWENVGSVWNSHNCSYYKHGSIISRKLEYLEEWYTSIDIPDFCIKPTQSGWTNDKTAIDWLFSFNKATKHRVQKGRPRLLLIDNYPTHCTLDFQDVCASNSIIPVWIVRHTTYLVQPLDSKAFLCLKQYFRTANNEEVVWGGSAYIKRDFFRIIGDIRRAALTTHNPILF